MKKRNIILIILVAIFSFSLLCGCNLSKKEETNDFNDKFDMKAATNTVDTYMKYLMKNDSENIKKLYSKELLKSETKNESENLNIVGYHLIDSGESGKSGEFKIMVSRVDLSKPFTVLDQYSVKVIKEDSDYKINKTTSEIEKEGFVENNKIKMRNKSEVNTNTVIDINNIPSYTFSKDDKANINKLSIPKDKFGIIDFSYTGDKMAVVTYNNDSYIGVVKIDESMLTQAQGSDDQQGDDNKQEGDGGKEEDKKAVGKSITNLDILKNSRVEFMTFSQDGKFVMVQYANDTIGKCIRLYISDSGDMIDFKFEEKFPMDKVDIIFSSFDEDKLNFDVVSKSGQTEDLSKYIGKWKLNLKDFKVVKM